MTTTTQRQTIASSIAVVKSLTTEPVRLPYARMLPIAQGLVARFAPNCARIEIAGSLRRQKDTIGDIEIIAVPTEALYAQLDGLLAEGKIRHAPHKRWGQKLRSFAFDTTAGDAVKVDLFLQPDPATWGINYMIRTGSSEFSHKMVTKRSQRGWMPDCFQVEDARVWWQGEALPTPEEQDVFDLWGMDYVAPSLRTAAYKPPPFREDARFAVLEQLPEFVPTPELKFTFADAERLTRESANWPLPTFPGGTGQAARDAIAASERERMRVQGAT